MRTEVLVLGSQLHTMLAAFADAAGLPLSPVVSSEYAKEIRRAKGRFVATSDMLAMDPENVRKATVSEAAAWSGDASAQDDPISKAGWELHESVHVITRNYVLFSFTAFLQMETTFYMRLDSENQSVGLLASTEPEGLNEEWVRLT